ncbi:iron ABC transporter permease [Corynebacterium doosanense CAU 212 = DSM 45436]|uniref:Iron ABC transporter permease n=2 Tax=Corynebacterium TaxID=1716 RepID=A0A097ICP5_9CORY|nr:iron ABC transporter permease [Corynebacterium doosanense CAU 212 = DSM 45436]
MSTRTDAPSAPSTKARQASRTLWILVLLASTAVAAVFSVMFGVRSIEWSDAYAALLGHTDTTEQAAAAARIPRTVLAILVGASLSLAGLAMQAVTRNPLADPGIFGVLSGASLAVVVGIAFFGLTSAVPTMLLAVLGAALAAVFVYTVGSLGRGGATPLKLALAGAATSAALGSLVSAVLLPRTDVLDSFRFWQIGGVGGAQWHTLAYGAPALGLGALICVVSARGMNALALGDEVATGLGVNVPLTRGVISIGAVILCGVSTALAGPIGFVGLIVPHALRLLFGPDHRWLVPATAIGGATLILLADTAGRVITRPSEIAVGIIMPLIGAPVFIWIVRRAKVREL